MEQLGEALARASQSGGCRKVSRSRRTTVELSLGVESVEITPVGKRKVQRSSVLLNDVIFVKLVSEKSIVIALMSVPPASRQPGCFGGCNRRQRTQRELRREILEFSSEEIALLILASLNQVCFGSSGERLRTKALVVVNPVAGKGKAASLWRTNVEPLLKESDNFEFEMVSTCEAGQALEIGATLLVDLLERTGEQEKFFLIILGGDGVVFELLNGLLRSRPDSYLNLLNRLVLCPLPAGSGNGLCFSSLCLAGEQFTMNAALRLLLRRQFGRKDLGMIHYEAFEGPQTCLFALTISWGLVADVDIQSEFLRSVFGDSRFTLYGLFKVMQKQEYEGTLSFETGQEIEPDYLTIFASLVPVAGRTVILSTDKRMDSGTVHIHRLRGREISRLGLIRAMEELEKRRDHCGLIPGFEPLVVDNFELVPGLTPVPGSAGIVVDGEPLTLSPIKVELIPAACSVFTA